MTTSSEEKESSCKGHQQSLLAVPLRKVARLNRRTVFVGALALFSVIALAVVGSLNGKKVQGNEKASPDKAKETPAQPSDQLVATPASYSDLKNGAPPTVASPGAAPAAAQPTYGGGAAHGVSPVAAKGPEHADAPGQRAKDAAGAMNSPVTFNTGEPPRGGDSAATVHPGLPMPAAAETRLPTYPVAQSDDQNMQGEKRTFAGERSNDFPYVKGSLLSPLSRYEIKAGTVLPALLITGINSDLPGQLVAQLRENVYDTVTGAYILIPQGTRLIGEYDSKIAFGQERVLVVWTRIILPNGDSMSLEAMPGIDLSGYAGITGKVNNHYGKLVTSVILGSVIGAGAQVAVGGQGAPNVPPSFGQLAVAGAAGNINQAAQQHVSKVLNMQPTIEVTPGEKINVFVTKDMILKPYRE